MVRSTGAANVASANLIAASLAPTAAPRRIVASASFVVAGDDPMTPSSASFFALAKNLAALAGEAEDPAFLEPIANALWTASDSARHMLRRSIVYSGGSRSRESSQS